MKPTPEQVQQWQLPKPDGGLHRNYYTADQMHEAFAAGAASMRDYVEAMDKALIVAQVEFMSELKELRAELAALLDAEVHSEPSATRTMLEQYDLDQSPEYRKGYEDGRLKGFDVGLRHGKEQSAPAPQEQEPVAHFDVAVNERTAAIRYDMRHGLKSGDPLYAAPAPQEQEPVRTLTPPCKGMNCGCTNGVDHSLECHAEHAASIAGGVFTKEPVNQTLLEACKKMMHYMECTEAVFSQGYMYLDMTLMPSLAKQARAAIAAAEVSNQVSGIAGELNLITTGCGCADQRDCTGACCNNDAEDAARYRWLADYLIDDSDGHGDAIVAAKTRQELNGVIDAAMKQGETK